MADQRIGASGTDHGEDARATSPLNESELAAIWISGATSARDRMPLRLLEEAGALGLGEAERVPHEVALGRIRERKRLRSRDPDERAEYQVAGGVAAAVPRVLVDAGVAQVDRQRAE